jgi:hypothetical protein
MSTVTPENVKLKDWIHVGFRDAVVCKIYDKELSKIEVVYLDDRNRAINEDVHFKDGKWKFLIDGPNGGYADGYPRLRTFVSILRVGRYKNFKNN